MKILNNVSSGFLILAMMLSISGKAVAATSINLGSASSFAILAGSTITNTGPSVINGDLGLNPGTALTGFPPGSINGSQQLTNGVALQAQADLVTAYNAAASQGGAATVSGDLGGQTLVPGVYNSASSLGLTGTLTLDGGGDPNAVFIFQAGSTLTTASGSNISFTNGAQACNVYWQVGSSATLGTNSSFAGSILALTSITLNTGASVQGRVLARNGAVTLDNNTITIPSCTVAVVPPTPVATSTSSASTVTITTVTATTSVATTTPVIAVATTTIPVVPPPFIGVTHATPSMPITGVRPSYLPLLLAGLFVIIIIGANKVILGDEFGG